MIPQQDMIILEVTYQDVNEGRTELAKKLFEYFKRGTIFYVVLKITGVEETQKISYEPIVSVDYNSDTEYVFNTWNYAINSIE